MRLDGLVTEVGCWTLNKFFVIVHKEDNAS